MRVAGHQKPTRPKSGVSTNQQPGLSRFIFVPNCAVILLHVTIFGRLQTFCLLASTCLPAASSRWHHTKMDIRTLWFRLVQFSS